MIKKQFATLVSCTVAIVSVAHADGVLGVAGPTGTVTVSQGGTGQTTLTANAFLTGNGTGAINSVAITGLVKGNGTGAPAAFAGTTCASSFVSALSAAGAATCTAVSNAFLTPGTFSNITGVGTLLAGATGTGFTIAFTPSTITGVLPVANGGTGQSTGNGTALDNISGLSFSGIVKRTGAGVYAAAVSATDYAPATTGTSILKGNSGGFAAATPSIDYAPATNGSGFQVGNGSGGFATFAPRTIETTWTPSDNSGATLTFTSVSVRYIQIDSEVCVFGQLTYPSTASSSSVVIGGLPVTVPNQTYATNGPFMVVSGNTGYIGEFQPSTATFNVVGGGSAITNATFSTKPVYFRGCYPAT